MSNSKSNSSSLTKIQNFFKFWSILSTVIFAIIIVLLVASLVFIIFNSFIDQINGTVISQYMENLFKVSFNQQITILSSYIIMLVCFGFLVFQYRRILKKELKNGTPFSFEIASEYKTLGILFLILPVVANLISAVLVLYIFEVMPIIFPVSILISLVFGLKFIFNYRIYTYGCQIKTQLIEIKSNK